MTPRSPSSSGSSACMSAAASRMALKVPIRLILITRSKSSSGIGPSRPTMRLAGPTPAQFTRMRAGPCVARAWPIAAAMPSPWSTSQRTATPPVRAAPFPASMLTSGSATLAPRSASLAAAAAPRPEPPPVTSAACPCGFMRSSFLLISVGPASSPQRFRRALGEEILQAFLRLRVARRDRRHQGLHQVAARAVLLGDARQHVHDGEVGVRLVFGDALRELDRLGQAGARLDHVVREAERKTFRGVVGAPGQH